MQCQPLLGEFKVSFAGLGSDGMRWDGPGGEIWVWGSTGEYTAEGMPIIYNFLKREYSAVFSGDLENSACIQCAFRSEKFCLAEPGSLASFLTPATSDISQNKAKP